ncbi:uncharacterized protein LOC132185564 [Corylus avellana]|uniref:uncharacterized protein LOC132185564 n=1 Tax=Corylus avellana TaxID=13451 RepID=UPI00286BB9BA|nr:uncharacterized protein LOC132185564 [Corylus avellana]
MIGLSKLCSALTVVFVVSLVAILALLFCMLRRRRRIRGKRVFDGEENSLYNPSKELFYFFCWKNQSRIEPQQAPSPSPHKRNSGEEEREGVDCENCSSSEKGKTKSKRVITEERVGVVGVSSSLPVVFMTIDVDEATLFSTPCASSPYYTPLPSPTREMESTT